MSLMDQVLSCCTSCSCCSCRASATLHAFMRRIMRAALFPAGAHCLTIQDVLSVCLAVSAKQRHTSDCKAMQVLQHQ